MINRNNCNKVFVTKTFTSDVYKWSPSCPDFSKKRRQEGSASVKPVFCTAVGGSQGQDWTTGYVYNLALIDGQQARLAYVECDYVQ
jgi:hypothetical protein